MTTYPLPTLACTIDDAGITKPNFADVLASLQASYKSIYGSDVNLDPDTQDGQWIGVISSAINDCNNATVAAYNAFSPVTAQGAGLSSVVKINGLRRLSATNSTVDCTITGVAGTIITGGVVSDTLGNRWDLPHTVVIPFTGSIIVTATAEQVGDIAAGIGTVTTIVTPTRGWQSVTNATAAAPGAPVESDAALRRRQAVSTSKPARGITSSILAEVENIEGVERSFIHENDTATTDGDGVPRNSISVIVEGGDVQDIVDAIGLKKPPGCGTYGSTSGTFTDQGNVSRTINFYVMAQDRIIVQVDLTALPNFVSTTVQLIQQAITDYINALPIGEDVLINKLWAPVYLYGAPVSATYDITEIRIAKFPASPTVGNVTVAFNEGATCQNSDITVNVS